MPYILSPKYFLIFYYLKEDDFIKIRNIFYLFSLSNNSIFEFYLMLHLQLSFLLPSLKVKVDRRV